MQKLPRDRHLIAEDSVAAQNIIVTVSSNREHEGFVSLPSMIKVICPLSCNDVLCRVGPRSEVESYEVESYVSLLLVL